MNSPYPELILVNGNIHTMDARQPQVEALAVALGRIIAIGSSAAVRALAGPETRVLDAKGQLVLPGFNDAHVHFIDGGFQLANVDLRGATSPEDFVRRLEAYVDARKAGGAVANAWITGGEWDHESWAGAPLPDREWIDAITPDIPVFVKRLDGHMALANSRALTLAGIGPETVAPPGGAIERDSSGRRITGLLKDTAMDLVSTKIPATTRAQRLHAAQAATDYAATLGVTSVQDVLAGSDVAIYSELQERGLLKTRVYAVWPMPKAEALLTTGLRAGFGSPMVRVGALKSFSDGSLGSGTAWFFEPYADQPGNVGLPGGEMFPDGALAERVRTADRAGLQVLIHAIGDRANHEVLSIFEAAIRANGPRDRRFRIEHAQHLRPGDIARFAESGIVASVQPYHAADDGRWAGKRIGPERCRMTYAFRSLLNAGVRLAFGSDWTVAPLNPLTGIETAVTRQTLDGAHPQGWNPEQKLSVQEAVEGYTIGSAFAEFQEHEKGSLTPGKLADLVVLERDIFRIPPEEIGATHVALTMVGGSIVFESKGISTGRTQ